MADRIPDYTVELSTTTGTGTYNLSGPPGGSAYRTFVQAVGTGQVVLYVARRKDNTVWEIGYGTITDGSPDTLTRNLIASSSGALINWVSGDVSPDPVRIMGAPLGVVISSLLRTNAATSRPAWLPQWGMWIDTDTPGGGIATLYVYDGGDDISLGTINTSTNVFTPAGVSFASSGEVATGTESAKAVAPDTLAANYHAQGKQTIYIPAAAMVARTTNGAAFTIGEEITNKNMARAFAFDTSTQEFVQFSIAMPVEWNEGTVTFIPIWTSSVGSGGVVWGMAAVAKGDGDTKDVAFGTAQTSTDTVQGTTQLHKGPESSAITVAGSPTAGDMVEFQVARNVSDGSDTAAGDVYLYGVLLFVTTNARNSA